MKNKILEIKQAGLPQVKPGSATNAKDFFNKVIKSQFDNKEAIKATHDTLMKYVNDSRAVYALRMFAAIPGRITRNFVEVF